MSEDIKDFKPHSLEQFRQVMKKRHEVKEYFSVELHRFIDYLDLLVLNAENGVESEVQHCKDKLTNIYFNKLYDKYKKEVNQ